MSDDIVARLRSISICGFRHDDPKSSFIDFHCQIRIPQNEPNRLAEIASTFARAVMIHRDAADEIARLRARIAELEAERASAS